MAMRQNGNDVKNSQMNYAYAHFSVGKPKMREFNWFIDPTVVQWRVALRR